MLTQRSCVILGANHKGHDLWLGHGFKVEWPGFEHRLDHWDNKCRVGREVGEHVMECHPMQEICFIGLITT